MFANEADHGCCHSRVLAPLGLQSSRSAETANQPLALATPNPMKTGYSR
jgi:hypothetical protein